MKLLGSLAIVLWGAIAASGQITPPAARPHPAVVRVIAPERDGLSFGSGALVAVNQRHGLVVTNWHVVAQATGQVVVVFPDGFRSGATVLNTDRDWDLAALAVWRPDVAPIPLAEDVPRPGEPLTIAGYGSGRYRTITGRCTQYVSPGGNHPFEMVELSAAARQGDSGGPIFNRRGELAGVLFGTAWGQTTGSYCGRVRWFLAAVANDFRDVSAGDTMIAQRPESPPSRVDDGWKASSQEAVAQAASAAPLTAAIQARPSHVADSEPSDRPFVAPEPGRTAFPAEPPADSNAATRSETTEPIDLAESTRLDQIKTVLAAIGLLALLFHGIRFLSMAGRS